MLCHYLFLVQKLKGLGFMGSWVQSSKFKLFSCSIILMFNYSNVRLLYPTFAKTAAGRHSRIQSNLRKSYGWQAFTHSGILAFTHSSIQAFSHSIIQSFSHSFYSRTSSMISKSNIFQTPSFGLILMIASY